MGVLSIRALLFGVYLGAPDFWKLPYIPEMHLNVITCTAGSNKLKHGRRMIDAWCSFFGLVVWGWPFAVKDVSGSK